MCAAQKGKNVQNIKVLNLANKIIRFLPSAEGKNQLNFSVKFKQFIHILDDFAFGSVCVFFETFTFLLEDRDEFLDFVSL